MRYGDKVACIFCLTPNSSELRADRKGRPFMICTAGCGARTFFRGTQSLVGPSMLWGPLTHALMNNDAEAAQVILRDAEGAKHERPIIHPAQQ